MKRASAVGPLRSLAFACGRRREIRTTGRSAPRMSPESGCARLSSLISLRRAPRRPDPTGLGWSRVEAYRDSRAGPAGARRSEIKGEPWAQPRAEDIRGGGRPAASAGAAHERAGTNACDGPTAGIDMGTGVTSALRGDRAPSFWREPVASKRPPRFEGGSFHANTPAVSCMRSLTSPRWCSVSP